MFYQRVICPNCGGYTDLIKLDLRKCSRCYHKIPLTAPVYGTCADGLDIKSGTKLGDIASFKEDKTNDN